MAKFITEFVGTLFLVLTIALLGPSTNPAAPLAVGFLLVALIYMGGHVSGAHYNPAVSIAFTVAKKLPVRELPSYLVAQMLGGLAGASIGYALTGATWMLVPGNLDQLAPAMGVESLFTFALMLTILNVASHSKMDGNPVYGLAIGSMVVAGAYAGGGISGAALNPAVGLSLGIIEALFPGGAPAGHMWIYGVFPILGALTATLVFRIQESAPSAAAN